VSSRPEHANADGRVGVAGVITPDAAGDVPPDPSCGGPLGLASPATVVVVGGGPAGSFLAIRLLRRARELGRLLNLTILEKKTEVCFYRPIAFSSWEGCNYCAGGISPRLADILRENGITLPDEVIESRATEVVVHGDWKSIQLPVPEEREMLSVFRGSRPRQREGRYANFDSFLLQTAADEGAHVVTAEVTGSRYSAAGRPVITYRTGVGADGDLLDQTIEADFAAFAAGVNRSPGMDLGADPLFRALRQMIPGLQPPKVRRAVIAEMQTDEDLLRPLEGEVHFAQYGSRDLDIEMSSLIPKDKWVTVVLLGRSIDRAALSDYVEIVQRFVELPHIQRLLPRKARLRPGCCCHPNMTVGAAQHPFGSRVALAGDMAVSRLYKDGLYSAYVTTSALADCVLDKGIDQASLARYYGPVVRAFHRDNRYGRVIFLLSRSVFAHPALSRVLYQAILTERKTTPRDKRRLAHVLWRIASGDDSYRHILAAMLHPASIWLILVGGLLTTIRNQATERLFGLNWTGIGRYSTGVPLEELEHKRQELFSIQGLEPPARPPQMERMYSIRIGAGEDAIFRQLGAFGDVDRQYFTPRFIHVHRTSGLANQAGTTIRYDIAPFRLSFTVALDKVVPRRYLLYRILDGFGRGGIFAFDVNLLKPGVNVLTIYVGFDFAREGGVLHRLGWSIGRRVFPQFAHDVLWNHSLCKIKHLAELDDKDPSG
jgi:flavin-dependent dehydrogenase